MLKVNLYLRLFAMFTLRFVIYIRTQYLRLVLTGVSNHAYSSARLDQTLLSRLTSLIVHYLEAWKSDNERRAEKEKERESLYSFKQHGEEAESDEQLIDKITKLNFPSYHKVMYLPTNTQSWARPHSHLVMYVPTILIAIITAEVDMIISDSPIWQPVIERRLLLQSGRVIFGRLHLTNKSSVKDVTCIIISICRSFLTSYKLIHWEIL